MHGMHRAGFIIRMKKNNGGVTTEYLKCFRYFVPWRQEWTWNAVKINSGLSSSSLCNSSKTPHAQPTRQRGLSETSHVYVIHTLCEGGVESSLNHGRSDCKQREFDALPHNFLPRWTLILRYTTNVVTTYGGRGSFSHSGKNYRRPQVWKHSEHLCRVRLAVFFKT